MRFATVLFTLLAAAASTKTVAGIAIEDRETNGQRMARGLPPLPPRDLTMRSSLVVAAKRGQPSSVPDPRCPHGTTYCCDYVKDHNDGLIAVLLGLLGLHFPDGVGIGKSCSKSPVGSVCHKTLACCTGTDYGSIVTTCSAL
ncbi:hypothetical protein CPB83DRAFT_850657 [Crepidotus variabilis]|uniref:Hydrophobin n=1 Tax=Crepidotus variabilis TaxID=179855 RepID=A0A9P6JSC8_9AGAR|nr:hypothetical protein CPB83DRAFT_850657 [Crepidotus variabilis]